MEANAQAAYTRWQDAITLRDNPQELEVQIEAAKTTLDMAGLQISAAAPVKDATETRWELGKQQWEDAMDEHRKCITKPEIGVEHLKQAIRFAAECGAPGSTPTKGPSSRGPARRRIIC